MEASSQDQEISYRVDGGEGQMGRTDENGILNITVTDGGHGIRVSDSQDEVYVDNYAGLGIVEDTLRTMPQLTAPEAGSEIPVNSTEEPEEPEEPEDPSPKMTKPQTREKIREQVPAERKMIRRIRGLRTERQTQAIQQKQITVQTDRKKQ